jgi:hypothetical protein
VYKLNKEARRIVKINNGMNDRNGAGVNEKIRIGNYITKGR